jgi:hypothetical protein
MNAKFLDKFFVSYNPTRNTISFNFISGDEFVAFNGKPSGSTLRFAGS